MRIGHASTPGTSVDNDDDFAFGVPFTEVLRADREPARHGGGPHGQRCGDNEAMASGLVRCGHCGQMNRVPAAAAGTPRCGKCHKPLPWITDADDATFREVAEGAKI